MKRRTLFKLSLFTLAAATPQLFAGWRGNLQKTSDHQLEASLLKVFNHPASARAIGLAYLQQSNETMTKQTLLSELCSRCEGGINSLVHMDRDALRTWIQQRERTDFAEGRTVKLQGWILSQTEVQLCALAALS